MAGLSGKSNQNGPLLSLLRSFGPLLVAFATSDNRPTNVRDLYWGPRCSFQKMAYLGSSFFVLNPETAFFLVHAEAIYMDEDRRFLLSWPYQAKPASGKSASLLLEPKHLIWGDRTSRFAASWGVSVRNQVSLRLFFPIYPGPWGGCRRQDRPSARFRSLKALTSFSFFLAKSWTSVISR